MSWLVVALVALAITVWPGPRDLQFPRAVRRGAASHSDSARHPTQPSTWKRWGQVLRRRHVDRSVAGHDEIADLVALGLEAGLPVGAAVALAQRTADPSGQAQEQEHSGRPPNTAGLPALLTVALGLSEDVGAPVATAARVAAEVLRDQRRGHERTSALTAGPRASMYLLTALPCLGPMGLLYVWLTGHHAVVGAEVGLVLAGLVLTTLGWLASRAILGRALRPSRLVRPQATVSAGTWG